MRRHLTSLVLLTTPRFSSSSLAARRTMSNSATALRIPVLSYIPGLGDIVRTKLRNATCPASELYRSGQLELLDLPLPPPAGADEPWALSDDHFQVLQQATVLLGDAHTVASAILTPSSVRLPTGVHGDGLFSKLKWMQATYAGIDPFQKRIEAEALPPPSFSLTRAGGVMPSAMAQYVFGWIIAIERKFFQAKELQQRKDWNKAVMDYRSYKDLTVGVLGFGDIGKEIGRLLTLAGFHVIGFKRNVNVNDADEIAGCAHSVTDSLRPVLEKSDFIVSVLPSTKGTRGLLNESNLVFCGRKKPVFINVGRGDVVSEATLLSALDKQWLSGAVLDVFAVEPLPTESPLWAHPRVHITPHVSAKSFPLDVADVFLLNLNYFLAREPLRYEVNWSRGY